jgi:Brp/Blh family beta-carotene 15,15'-monooxygenase
VVEQFITLDIINLCALLFIILIGLPHGAFDGAIAAHLGAGKSAYTAAKFIIYYGLTSATIIALWIFLPGEMLALFLIISVIHFGWGDANSKFGLPFLVQIALHGGVPVFGIIYFHPDEVASLFSILTFGAPELAIRLGQLAAPILLSLGVLYALLALRESALRRRFVEILIITALLAALPPLVGFALYFCIIHTSRHMRRIWHILTAAAAPKRLIMQAAGYTIASWLFGGSAFLWLNESTLETELIQIIFIGLAALTVPHMILVDGFFRTEKEDRSE